MRQRPPRRRARTTLRAYRATTIRLPGSAARRRPAARSPCAPGSLGSAWSPALVGAGLAIYLGVPWFAWLMGAVALVAAVDLAWILHRKARGEPG